MAGMAQGARTGPRGIPSPASERGERGVYGSLVSEAPSDAAPSRVTGPRTIAVTLYCPDGTCPALASSNERIAFSGSQGCSVSDSASQSLFCAAKKSPP